MDLMGGLERTLHGKVKPSTLRISSHILAKTDIFSDYTMLYATFIHLRIRAWNVICHR
jgi:hypothetical protein